MKNEPINIKKNGRCPSCNNLIVRDHRTLPNTKFYDLKGIVVNGNKISGHCRVCRVLLELKAAEKPKAIIKKRGKIIDGTKKDKD